MNGTPTVGFFFIANFYIMPFNKNLQTNGGAPQTAYLYNLVRSCQEPEAQQAVQALETVIPKAKIRVKKYFKAWRADIRLENKRYFKVVFKDVEQLIRTATSIASRYETALC